MNLYDNDDINVLIVDDNADILFALKLALEQNGRRIFTTTHPQDVMQICSDHDISIVLMDIQMPDISGLQLLDLLKSNSLTEHVMVILITGQFMRSEDAVSGLRMGAVDVLFKPLDLYITQAKINSLITLVNYQREIRQKNLELENFQKKLYLAIEQAEKSKEVKENFLANMSHEIRTPLTAITGLTHLLKKTETNQEQSHLVDLLEHSTQSLLALVNDILDSEKIDAGKIAINRLDTNINALVTNVSDLLRPLAVQKGLELKCHIADDVPQSVIIDALRLNQILMNLINNAIKFTETGQVEVMLKVVALSPHRVNLQFIVSDTGIGIPEVSRNKVFERFEQAEDKTWQKFGGTGLGLSIVKKLIELKGGTLSVESVVGEGTTFVFTNWYDLAVDRSGGSNETILSPAFSTSYRIHILLAEDNPINQLITTKILKGWNIHVDIAVNGAEAFEKAACNAYDLILMDTHMPVMNGYEATRKIRKELSDAKKDIPIVSFSASIMDTDKVEARDAGVNAFISKPFVPSELYDVIKSLVIIK
ncbi:response regulator [Mucilaginibacter sp. PAMB04274]|uniref:response regulator n=1 Tax=Mucilaginibacter sp. PAMB04274 TaxID=3138568 RepID=UPI0031F66EF4